jgi:hypothetical protein
MRDRLSRKRKMIKSDEEWRRRWGSKIKMLIEKDQKNI